MKTDATKWLFAIGLTLAIATGILSVNYAEKVKNKEVKEELDRIEIQMDKLQGELVNFKI